MPVSGNFHPWLEEFPGEILPEVFAVVLESWPRFLASLPKRKIEKRITHNFVRHLRGEVRHRHGFTFDYHYPLVSTDRDVERGELDIKVTVCLAEDVYFAFECKRLYPTRDRPRAEDYVGPGGMGCFLTGQYNGKAGCGGMIGYVLHGPARRARDAVAERVAANPQHLNLLPPRRLVPAELHPSHPEIELSRHSRPSQGFKIYHVFLALDQEPPDAS